MNNEQYGNGAACGVCVEGCFSRNGAQECFKAIVDNLCPECKRGDLDLGWGGDGRWPLTWNYIACPQAEPIFSTQGSNASYGKLKIEGVGAVTDVQLNGMAATLQPDGYFVLFNDPNQSLSCGPRVDFTANGAARSACLDPSLFPGTCNGAAPCGGGGGAAPTPLTAPANDGGLATTKKSTTTTNTSKYPVCGKWSNGILHPNGRACCPRSCGGCGGTDCHRLKGGAPKCCASKLLTTYKRSCSNNPAPCTKY
jgi:hypothetical protein